MTAHFRMLVAGAKLPLNGSWGKSIVSTCFWDRNWNRLWLHRRHIEWKVSKQLCCHLHNCQLFFDATQNPAHLVDQSNGDNAKSEANNRPIDRSERKTERKSESNETKSSNTDCRHNAISLYLPLSLSLCFSLWHARNLSLLSGIIKWKILHIFHSITGNEPYERDGERTQSSFAFKLRLLFIARQQLIYKFRMATTGLNRRLPIDTQLFNGLSDRRLAIPSISCQRKCGVLCASLANVNIIKLQFKFSVSRMGHDQLYPHNSPSAAASKSPT